MGYAATSGTSVVIDDGYNWEQDVPERPIMPPASQSLDTMNASEHHNSVYLDEEEPEDMYDMAKEHNQSSDQSSASSNTDNEPISPDDSRRMPNQPHSTTL